MGQVKSFRGNSWPAGRILCMLRVCAKCDLGSKFFCTYAVILCVSGIVVFVDEESKSEFFSSLILSKHISGWEIKQKLRFKQ